MQLRILRPAIRLVATAAVVGLITVACGSDAGLVAEVDINQPSAADTNDGGETESGAEAPDGVDASGGTSTGGAVEGLVVSCPAVAADFAGQEMAQPRFAGEDLRCADFTGAVFAQGSLSNSDVSGADFHLNHLLSNSLGRCHRNWRRLLRSCVCPRLDTRFELHRGAAR